MFSFLVKITIVIHLLVYVSLSSAYDSNKEQDCIIKALWAEARGTSSAEIHKVATVIWNRKQKSNKSYCAVIYQKNQFTFDKNKPVIVTLDSSKSYLTILGFSQSMLTGTFTAEPTVKNALYFHNLKVVPNWKYNELKLLKTTEWHKYYSQVQIMLYKNNT